MGLATALRKRRYIDSFIISNKKRGAAACDARALQDRDSTTIAGDQAIQKVGRLWRLQLSEGVRLTPTTLTPNSLRRRTHRCPTLPSPQTKNEAG